MPKVEIHDWPSMAIRGTMIDISHGPLPPKKKSNARSTSSSMEKRTNTIFTPKTA